MKKKLSFALVAALLATLVIATPALAYCDPVTGTVLDSKTSAPWAYGGTVTVWDCSDIDGTPLGGPQAFANGSFSVPVSGAPAFPPGYLCIEIEFTDPGTGYGPPDTKWEVIPSTGAGSATCPLGNIYTDTGPNIVTLAEAEAGSSNVWLPVALAAVALVGAGGVVLLLRRRRVA
jgi:hypothetical protein